MTLGTGQTTATPTRVFTTSKSIGVHAALYLIGGIVYLLVLLLGFVFSLNSPASDSKMPGITGGLSVIGIFAIAKGVSLLKSFTRITIDDAGLRAEGLIASRSLRWDQIRAATRKKKSDMFGTSSTELALLDEREKPLLAIPDHIGDFDALAHEIESRVAAARGTTEAAAAEQRFHQKTGKRTRVVAVIASSFLLIVFGIGFGLGVNETLHARRFASEGVTTDAKIVRRYMVSVTPRIEYAFADRDGRRFTRETAMDKSAWEDLEGRSTVPVEYLASDPDWNRLAEGETEAEMFGGKFLLLTGGGLLLFAAMLVMSLLGYDLRSEDGRMKLVRYGQPVTAPTTVRAPPPAPPTTTSMSPVMVEPAPAPLAPRKPVGLIALGAIAIVFGVLGLLRAGVAIMIAAIGSFQIGQQQLFVQNSAMHTGLAVADGTLALLLIVAGIGLCMLRPWSRVLGLMVAALQLLSTAAAVALAILELKEQQDLPEGGAGLHQRTQAIGFFFGQTIAAIFPIVLLILCARRSTREALSKGGIR